MSLTAGSLAFTGMDRSGPLDLTFAALTDIAAGTVIHFTNNNWDGSTLDASAGTWSWTATANVAAGTIVTLDDLVPADPYGTVEASSNHGTVTYSGGTYKVFSADTIYAYAGDAAAPGFIAAIGIWPWSSTETLDGTGLVDGVTAINLGADASNPIIAEYVGPTAGLTGFDDYATALNTTSNWVKQSTGNNAGQDGVAPDAPLPVTALTVDPNAQTIGFAPGSLTQQVTEGDAGTFTIVTFTVQRTGSTEGSVAFSGGVAFAEDSGITTADFGRAIPGFSGVIADGQSSATASIRIAGDIRSEADEAFQIVLTDVAGSEKPAVIGGSGQATVVIVNDDPMQVVSFSADTGGSRTIVEGNDGATVVTFTVERTGSTVGQLDFVVNVLSSSLEDDDYVDGQPFSPFTGTMLAGESSYSFTISFQGDTRFEAVDAITLQLADVHNAEVGARVTDDYTRAAQVYLDDGDAQPTTIRAGEVAEGAIRLADDFTIAAGGRLVSDLNGGLRWTGVQSDVTVDNFGLISGGERAFARDGGSGTLVFNNHFGASIEGLMQFRNISTGSTATLNNAGTIGSASSNALQLSESGGRVTINNLRTGLITNDYAGSDVIKDGRNVVINNRGDIRSAADQLTDDGNLTFGGDAIDIGSGRGSTVNNFAGAVVEGSRHAITGKRDLTVFNGEDAVLLGRNGSGINVDNNASPEQMVKVINHGTITGASMGYADSDGDAIDADGLLTLYNFGVVQGVGHNGYHNGGPNISQGVAIGGGMIVNGAGALIYGFGNAIQVDDSETGPALAAVKIINDGTIQGDGHGATGVTAADAAAVDFTGREAINIIGDFADVVINRGTIIGGVSLGGGGDVFYASTGSTVSGPIDGGLGVDMAVLRGAGEGQLAATTGIEAIRVQSGNWTLTSETALVVRLGADAGVLRLAEAVLADDAFSGRIVGLHEGSQIDLRGIGLASDATLRPINAAHGELTVIAGGREVTLDIQTTDLPAHVAFAMADDGTGGTLLTVQTDAVWL